MVNCEYLKKCPYFKYVEEEDLYRTERSVYVFEQFVDGNIYKGEIYVPLGNSEAAYDWNFAFYKEVENPFRIIAFKCKDIKESEETPVWFQELLKPIIHKIRLKRLFNS